jgi:hypothetical protein
MKVDGFLGILEKEEIMNHYWMTTQWPNYQGESSMEDPHEGVWVQAQVKSVLDGCTEGDIVFIYESSSGPIRLEGTTKVYPYKGKMAIVDIVKVSSAVAQNPKIDHYENRDKIWWRYYRETEAIKHLDAPILLPMVNKTLGYLPNNVLRGFGDKHSGLKELTVAQATDFMHLAGLDI